MLINTKYEGFYGSVEQVGSHSIRTLFYHFLGVPLWPQESYLVEGSGLFGSEQKVTEISRHRGSVRAGFARGMTLALAFWCTAAAVTTFFMFQGAAFDGDPTPMGYSIVSIGLVALSILLAIAAVVAFIATRGALSPEEQAKRAVYARFIGVPIDPAYLDKPWSQRDDLLRALADRAEHLRLAASHDAWKQWPSLILRPEFGDPESLAMGFTLTRLCVAAPPEGLDPQTLAPLHTQLWQRLVQLGGAPRA